MLIKSNFTCSFLGVFGFPSALDDMNVVEKLKEEEENTEQTVKYLNLEDIATQQASAGAYVHFFLVHLLYHFSSHNGNTITLCPEVEDNPMMKGSVPQAVLLIDNLKEAEVRAKWENCVPGSNGYRGEYVR